MQILAVDIGTGTQDVFLLRGGLSLENGFKLVLPSPTMRVRAALQQATARGDDVLLTGVTMGGGPSHWAAEAHVRAGRRLFATPDAARSFNDDLELVRRELGLEIVDEAEAARLRAATRLELCDLDLPALRAAFAAFGVTLAPRAAAVAVFDHGAAPPGVSDRQFRFDYLQQAVAGGGGLAAFAYTADALPPILTRMQAVRRSAAGLDCPLVLMDTAPAAVWGAALDPRVAGWRRQLIANLGNFHTLAFRLGPSGIEGLFEHHTGLLDRARLEGMLRALAEGTLTHREVFDSNGHGALLLDREPLRLQGALAVTGPRRGLLQGSALDPHFAVPGGDMMLAGCFGLLRALAVRVPELAGPIEAALRPGESGRPPWEAEA